MPDVFEGDPGTDRLQPWVLPAQSYHEVGGEALVDAVDAPDVDEVKVDADLGRSGGRLGPALKHGLAVGETRDKKHQKGTDKQGLECCVRAHVA